MALIFILLYAPIVTLVVLSFNASKTRAKWGGFTLHWYRSLFANTEIMNALYTTLIIALLASAIATVLGTLACIGINSMSKKSRTVFMGITNIPMLNGEIVMGISLMLLFIICRIQLGFGTILMAHITFNVPYVILSVMPKLKQTNKSTYEAALDLGASPLYAFWKVIFPDIMPGVVSGFLLSFTMSLDDFVITYFTKGPGVDTLSTKIYAEVRKGIKPEMYSLSTILFVTVLLLLLLVNVNPSPKEEKEEAKEREAMAKKGIRFRITKRVVFRRILPIAMVLVIGGGGIYYGSQNASAGGSQQLIVYNWGEYMDSDVIDIFEEETGIKVVYDEFETNEIMYPKVEAGSSAYDVVCPSDYMVQKMIENDLIQELDYDKIPNAKENIGAQYYEQAAAYDPGNKYCVPYCWGTVGIIYNKTMVDTPPTKWADLWDEKYADNILMMDSIKDSFMVALKKNGFSSNSLDESELQIATDDLIAQKPLVQAYVVDQVRDKMIGGEAAIGVMFSGDAIYVIGENPDLDYVIPEEGTNVWIDGWVIPKNKENAEKFIDFMCRPDVALKNFEYITYGTPNTAARELIEDEDLKNSPIAFPDLTQYNNLETFLYLGEDGEELFNKYWKEVMSN